jgi:hypothetical protein
MGKKDKHLVPECKNLEELSKFFQKDGICNQMALQMINESYEDLLELYNISNKAKNSPKSEIIKLFEKLDGKLDEYTETMLVKDDSDKTFPFISFLLESYRLIFMKWSKQKMKIKKKYYDSVVHANKIYKFFRNFNSEENPPIFNYKIKLMKAYALHILVPDEGLEYLKDVLYYFRTNYEINKKFVKKFENKIKFYISELEELKEYERTHNMHIETDAINNKDGKKENVNRFILTEKAAPEVMKSIYDKISDLQFETIDCEFLEFLKVWDNGKPLLWKDFYPQLIRFIENLDKKGLINVPKVKGKKAPHKTIASGLQFLDSEGMNFKNARQRKHESKGKTDGKKRAIDSIFQNLS